jgi:hypothetical protein
MVLATVFSTKDVIVHFDECRQGILNEPEIRSSASFDRKGMMWGFGWCCRQRLSGDTVLFCQRGILPRVIEKGDVRGNLKCEGRRNVIYSRARLLSSTHIAAECLEAEDSGDAWKREWQMLLDPNFAAEIVRVLRAGPDYVYPVVPQMWFGEVVVAVLAWGALVRFTGDLTKTLSELKAMRRAQRKHALR